MTDKIPHMAMPARRKLMSRSDTRQPAGASEDASNDDRWTEVPVLLASLYGIVDRLETLFSSRKFTPDGHLVGSIGEVIAAHMFGLTLLPASYPDHDAEAGDGRRVQIKLTQGARGVALRAEPDHLLVLLLAPDRAIKLVYNGRGDSPWSQAGKLQRNGQRQISLVCLRAIDASVPGRNRMPLRATIDLSLPGLGNERRRRSRAPGGGFLTCRPYRLAAHSPRDNSQHFRLRADCTRGARMLPAICLHLLPRRRRHERKGK